MWVRCNGEQYQNIYGNALFGVCCEENCLDEVYGELGSIRDILFSQGQEEYVELLASPLVTENEKRAALEKVFMGRIQPVTLNFLCLVSEKGRIRFCLRYAQSSRSFMKSIIIS